MGGSRTGGGSQHVTTDARRSSFPPSPSQQQSCSGYDARTSPDPTNRLSRLKHRSFGELGFRERENLQEWLISSPDAFGEDLLIIQKEFDGFDETRERLDLLALDKNGQLVLIENKLDDSGRDLVWQSLKYAAYCSSLKTSQIIEIFRSYLDRHHGGTGSEAATIISEFLDGADLEETVLNEGNSQRIMMVAANFRKEVTATVMWLLGHGRTIQRSLTLAVSRNSVQRGLMQKFGIVSRNCQIGTRLGKQRAPCCVAPSIPRICLKTTREPSELGKAQHARPFR